MDIALDSWTHKPRKVYITLNAL